MTPKAKKSIIIVLTVIAAIVGAALKFLTQPIEVVPVETPAMVEQPVVAVPVEPVVPAVPVEATPLEPKPELGGALVEDDKE
jgi:hypothetical protein